MSIRKSILLAAAVAMTIALPSRNVAETASAKTGAVFVMTNDVEKNEIITYRRGADGSLRERHTFQTGGRGSGGTTDPLGSQGSLTLSPNHDLLFAVNAGSGTISVFRVFGSDLLLTDRISSGGSEPVAVAQWGNLVYVLNAGGNSNVTGFQLAGLGRLKPIADSTTYLSTSNSGAGSLAFSPDGKFLLVTEKVTNNIDAFKVQNNGKLGPIVVTAGAGPGTFSVVFAPNGKAFASETGAAGTSGEAAFSSFALASNGALTPISASVRTEGSAACWEAITPDGKYAYVANSATSTIAGFAIGGDGKLTPLAGTLVGFLPDKSTDIDTAISSDGKYLYTLNSGTGTVGIFGIQQNGTLTNLGDADGLTASAGFNGLAAY